MPTYALSALLLPEWECTSIYRASIASRDKNYT